MGGVQNGSGNSKGVGGLLSGQKREKCLFGQNLGKNPSKHTRWDICKDKESNLGPVAGF